MQKKSDYKVKVALEASLYEQFEQAYDADRHRFGVVMTQRIKNREYRARTMAKILRMIDAFEEGWGESHGAYLCFMGVNKSTLLGVVMNENSKIVGYITQNGRLEDAIYKLDREILQQISVKMQSSFFSPDVRDSFSFQNMPPVKPLRVEENAKTVVTHKAGDDNIILRTNERWAIEWIQDARKIREDVEVQVDNSDIEPLNRNMVVSMPLVWMVLTHKTFPLRYQADRRKGEPAFDTTQLRKDETTLVHTCIDNRAIAYVGEQWSLRMFQRFKRIYSVSVRELFSSDIGKIYSFPAAWIKLSPGDAPRESTLRKFMD